MIATTASLGILCGTEQDDRWHDRFPKLAPCVPDPDSVEANRTVESMIASAE
jgi:hypothetical protein